MRSLFPPFELTEPPHVLFVDKKCDPATLQLAQGLKPYGTRIVYDLCDPIWLQADINRQRSWQPEAMLRLADRITVPTRMLAQDLIRQYPVLAAKSIAVIPDSLDFNEPGLTEPAEPRQRDLLRIGWIGTSLNMEHIPMMADAISEVHRQHPVTFRLITRSHQGLVTAIPYVATEYWPWTLDNCHAALRDCDCAVLPMADKPATRTKSANRLQLCLALGVPVVASPLPSYKDLVGDDSEIVFFAETPAQWRQALLELMDFTLRWD